MFKMLNNLFKRTVTVQLDTNVSLTVEPTTGGANAVIVEKGEYFIRKESCYFDSLNSLVNSLHLTDNEIVRKLSKAF